jgi:serine/threonine-protein kinase
MTERDLFEAALDLSPENRAAYLDGVCGVDTTLRQRLDGLLSQHSRASSFLEQPAFSALATVDEQAVNERPGTFIGPYKLLEQIGEGTFGIVFLAEQQQPVRRKVALKVLKPGMDSRQVIARFEAERQALALMDHPNIAKVLDAGETANGRPHFVMELVRGGPITDYCDQHGLSVRERLELFVSVCQAVQHAHQKAIIHRDIKPSNVLVTLRDGMPVVKVIDFGIAKALGQQLTDKTVCTSFAQLVGTPLYMSPEQAELGGLDVDTRTDIYSLGVLLYELLTGTTPVDQQRVESASYDEVRRIIREEEAPVPSTRINTLGEAATIVSACRQSDPKRLSLQLHGELDWIVMKALEKERIRRYETAGALAADVQHYLRDEEVSACPPSAAYRFRKFARRHRAVLTMASVVTLALLLVVAALAGSIGWVVRDRETREAALDGQMNHSLDEAESLVRDGKWPDALVAIERAEQLHAAAGRLEFPQRFVELKKDLAMAGRLESIYRQPGRQELVQSQLKMTGRLEELRGQPDKEDIFSGHELAAEYAQAFRDYGIDLEKLSVAEAAERIRARSIRRELARAVDFWSSMRRRTGGRDTPDWKQLLEVTKLADSDPWRTQLRDALVRGDRKRLEALAAHLPSLPPDTLHLLGSALNELGASKEALALLRQAQQQYPGDLWLNDALGAICNALRHYDDSARFYAAALAVRPRNPYILCALGRALSARSAPEAIAAFTKAIDLKPDYRDAWQARAFAYDRLKQWDKAVADWSKFVEWDPNASWVWWRRGFAYARLGQWDKALVDYSRVTALDPKNARAWSNRGNAHWCVGHAKEALAAYTKALELDAKLTAAWNNRANAYWNLGQLDQAIADYSKALAVDPRHPKALPNRIRAYATLGQWANAAADYPRLLELDPNDHWRWYRAAALYLQIGDTEAYDRACWQMLERFGNTDHPAVAEQTAKTCLLAPGAVGDFDRVLKLADLAVKKNPSDRWILLTRGLVEYRAGRPADALAWLERVAAKADGSNTDATAFAVQAMALYHLAKAAEARTALERAQAIIAQKMPHPSRGQRFGGDWHDWLHSQILLREAEGLCSEKRAGGGGDKRGTHEWSPRRLHEVKGKQCQKMRLWPDLRVRWSSVSRLERLSSRYSFARRSPSITIWRAEPRPPAAFPFRHSEKRCGLALIPASRSCS